MTQVTNDDNKTLTGFVMNSNAVKRGGVYEAVGVSAPRPTTRANVEASQDAVAVLKEIAAERAQDSRKRAETVK